MDRTNPRKAQAQEVRMSFLRLYYEQLIGARIIGVGIQSDMTPMLVLKMASGDRVRALVSSDEEGNGPGFLHGLPRITERRKP